MNSSVRTSISVVGMSCSLLVLGVDSSLPPREAALGPTVHGRRDNHNGPPQTLPVGGAPITIP
jgi:hypothetical protein